MTKERKYKAEQLGREIMGMLLKNKPYHEVSSVIKKLAKPRG